MPVPAAVQGRRNSAADWAVPTMVWRLVSKVRVSAGLVSSSARPPRRGHNHLLPVCSRGPPSPLLLRT